MVPLVHGSAAQGGVLGATDTELVGLQAIRHAGADWPSPGGLEVITHTGLPDIQKTRRGTGDVKAARDPLKVCGSRGRGARCPGCCEPAVQQLAACLGSGVGRGNLLA